MNKYQEALKNIEIIKDFIDTQRREAMLGRIKNFSSKYLVKTFQEIHNVYYDIKELVDKAKELSDSNNELERTIHSLDCELSDVYNPKPYKFEDLKVGMWVWDDTEEEFIFIKKILTKKDCNFLYHDENKKVFMSEWYAIEFEENRFFPVQMANLRR